MLKKEHPHITCLKALLEQYTSPEIRARFSAEIKFYENLFVPGKGYRVTFKEWHDFYEQGFYDETGHFVRVWHPLVFECPPGEEIAYANLEETLHHIIIRFVQGGKGVNIQEVNRKLGRPWFEVFMDKIVKSFEPLHKIGVKLVQEPSNNPTAKKIRARYFERTSKPANQEEHLSMHNPLNFKKKRVKMLLGIRR